MRRTIFEHVLLAAPLHRLALLLLKVFGWRVEGQRADLPKYVVIGAPHTSNWDFPVFLALAFALRLKPVWMGKHTLFRWPFRRLFEWLGGIPIDRARAHNVVSQSIEAFGEQEEMVMVIAPEGTRKKVRYWKTGFYYIAQGANVPIVLGFVDYRRQVGGLGPVVTPTGDIETDMKLIRAFYADKAGKHPDQ